MPVVYRKKPLLKGKGSLRQAIHGVRRPVDETGSGIPSIAVKFVTGEDEWRLLSVQDLVHKKVGVLIDLAVELGIVFDDLEEADLKVLCRQILGAAKKPVVVLRYPGYFRITANERREEGFVWAKHIFWATDVRKRALTICVMGGIAEALPSGTLIEWKENIGVLFKDQHYMTIALGATLCSLLVRALDLPRLSLVVVGESSTGKSAMQRACLSVIDSGSNLKSASGTALGLQMLMTAQPDQPVFIEDTRQLDDPAGLVKLFFDTGNGAARAVGSAGQTAVVGEALRCTIIASNERTIAEGAMGRSGVQMDAGLEARVFELVVQAKHGVFNAFEEEHDPAEYAELISRRSKKYFGAVWPAWVEMVAENMAAIRTLLDKRLPKYRRLLEDAVQAEDAVSKRLISGYASWQFALSLAIDYKLIPLKKSAVSDAFISVLVEQQKQRGAGETRHGDEILGAVRHALDRNPKCFVAWADRSKLINGMWGYTRDFDGERYYLLFPRMLSELFKTYGDRDVLRAIDDAGLLKKNKGEKTLAVRLNPGEEPKRFYAISARIQGDG